MQDPGALTASFYAGVSGAPRGDTQIDLEDMVCGDIDVNGLLYPGSRTRFSMISDGSSNTLMLGERTYVFRTWMSGATRVGKPPQPPKRICTGATKNVVYPINADHAQFGYHVADRSAPPEAKKKRCF